MTRLEDLTPNASIRGILPDRQIGVREPVLPRYERATFEKGLISPQGQPLAAFMCPGSPLLDSVLDLTLERNRDLLRRGTVLVDERDQGTEPRVFFYLEHGIQDASLTRSGERRVISKRVLHIEMDKGGAARHIHYAPYLGFRPLAGDEPSIEDIFARPECAWIGRDTEWKAQVHAATAIVPEHLDEVRKERLDRIARTEAAVKGNSRLNSGEARKRADLLQGRLQKRLEELTLEAQIAPLPPVIQGGFLVVPVGLILAMQGKPAPLAAQVADTASAARARAIVMEVERSLGFEPVDREFEKIGYDVVSTVPGTGKLRFIEVKGRVSGAKSITVTRNEVLYSLNKPDDFILAIVEFLDEASHRVHCIRRPFLREPDFLVTSSEYNFAGLIDRAEAPQ